MRVIARSPREATLATQGSRAGSLGRVARAPRCTEDKALFDFCGNPIPPREISKSPVTTSRHGSQNRILTINKGRFIVR
jgi:hypothetical protein